MVNEEGTMEKIIQLNDAQYITPSFNLKEPFSHGNAVMLFYRDGCPHCDHFKPDFMRAALQDDQNLYIMVNTAQSPDIMRLLDRQNAPFRVRGVPTMVSFNRGKYFSKFGGDRTAQNTLLYAQGIGKAKRTFNPNV